MNGSAKPSAFPDTCEGDFLIYTREIQDTNISLVILYCPTLEADWDALQLAFAITIDYIDDEMIDHRYDVVQPHPYITSIVPDTNVSLVLRLQANRLTVVSSRLRFDSAATTLSWMAAWQLDVKRNGICVASLFERDGKEAS